MKPVSGLQLRGFFLVAVPLMFQLAFAAAASGLFLRLNGEMERELRSQDVIRQAFFLSREVTTNVVTDNITHRAGAPIDISSAKAQVEKGLKNIDAFCSSLQSRPNQKKNAILLNKGAHQLKKILLLELNPQGFGSDVERALNQMRLISAAPLVADKLMAIINTEEKEGEQHLADSQRSVEQLISISVAGVVLSICVAIGLSFYYSHSIKRPIQHLCENGVLLSMRKELLPQLDARDEFSKLDRLLHMVAQSVQKALSREQSIVDNAGDMICTIDANGNLRSINMVGGRLLGYSPESLLSSQLDALTAPEHIELARSSLGKCVNSKESQQFELKLVAEDGTVIDTLWSCLWSPTHKLLFCVVHNVTVQKKAERLRDDFTRMISNDLRQPLIAINDSMLVITSGDAGELSESVAMDVSVVGNNVNRLIDMVNDLLDFQQLNSEGISLEIGSYDLVEVCRDAVSLVQPLAQDRGISVTLPSGTCLFSCDGKKIMQALTNLLSNAIKYSPDNGIVNVDLLETNESIQVKVKDQGPGVPEEFKQSIFEPFQQAPTAQGKVGTGLGLAICKSIAEVHGGSVYVTESSAGGSVFCMEIPRMTPANESNLQR